MKRKLLTLLAAVLCIGSASAQRDRNNNRSTGRMNDCPKAYLGVSTGIENPAGLLGVNFELPIGDFSAGAGIGLGTWGYKMYAEGRHYFKPCNKGWAIGAGITFSTGAKNVTINDVEMVGGGTRDIPVDLHPVATAFFSGYHFFNLGRRSRFYLQGGYSIRLTDDVYQAQYPYYFVDDTMMDVLAPGGIILALGFSFGL